MNFKLKAFIQNAVSKLPEEFSYNIYFLLQRNFGSLRADKIDYIQHFKSANELLSSFERANIEYKDKQFLELGTGRTVIIPLALWLCGVNSVTTVDKNPYLNEDIMNDYLGYMQKNREIIQEALGGRVIGTKFDYLLENIKPKSFKTSDFGISYISPADAQKLDFADGSFDIFYSWDVLEHIPKDILIGVFKEVFRVLKKDGFMLNNIDYSDHFAYSDKNISAINFLQFNDKEFDELAGNRYMYMNRLRHSDFTAIFGDIGFCELFANKKGDEPLLEKAESVGFVLDSKFSNYSADDINTTSAVIISTKK